MGCTEQELEDLVRAYQAGHEERHALVIIDCLQPTIRRYLAFKGVRDADLDDLTQEVVLKISRNLSGFRFQGSLVAWAHTIAKNHFSKRVPQWMRRREMLTSLDDTGPGAPSEVDRTADGGASPLDRALAKEALAAVRRLPGKQRACFEYFLQGYSYREIGALVGISANAAGVNIHLARQRIRELLGDRCGPPVASPPAPIRTKTAIERSS